MPTECLYCTHNELQKDLMIEICQLEVSTVYLFREQTYRGRCIVTYKDHYVELFQLTDADLLSYMKEVNKVAAALKFLFNAEKINYGAYSDKLKHLHFHLVPKYIDGPDFGSVFFMNPQNKYLTDFEYEQMIGQIKIALAESY